MLMPRHNHNAGRKPLTTPLKLPTTKPKLVVVDAPIPVKVQSPHPVSVPARHGGYSHKWMQEIDYMSPGVLVAVADYIGREV